MNDALLESTTEGERLRLAAAGAWTAQHARALEARIDAETRKPDAITRVVIDMAGIERLDTFGAWLLERLVRAWKARGCDTDVVGLADNYRGLVDEVHGVDPDKKPARHTG